MDHASFFSEATLIEIGVYTSNDLTYNSIRFKKPLDIFDRKFKEKVLKII